MPTSKLLFLLKEGSTYGTQAYGSGMPNNGLYNSSKFVVDMLNRHGATATLVQVVDSDGIDAEIKKYTPDIVVIEALWVEPKNLKALQDLNPQVKFLVRIHSETAFLVQETIAIAWIASYLEQGVTVGFNSYRTSQIMKNLYPAGLVVFSPDYIHILDTPPPPVTKTGFDIGCFGALRLMKNQLNQAIAAIQFGRESGQPINFHINTSFHGDTSGSAILANIRALFAGDPSKLVEHPWHTEAEFTALLTTMDAVMQVSLSESFNLVAAEAANLRVPIVVSYEINWASEHSKTIPTSVAAITHTLHKALDNEHLVKGNVAGLREYTDVSRAIWLDFIRG